jgi:hypothetical protein
MRQTASFDHLVRTDKHAYLQRETPAGGLLQRRKASKWRGIGRHGRPDAKIASGAPDHPIRLGEAALNEKREHNQRSR